jgi:hypothetical protein
MLFKYQYYMIDKLKYYLLISIIIIGIIVFYQRNLIINKYYPRY